MGVKGLLLEPQACFRPVTLRVLRRLAARLASDAAYLDWEQDLGADISQTDIQSEQRAEPSLKNEGAGSHSMEEWELLES
jgi:hypothetical protein